MIHDILFVLFASACSAFFSWFLDYALGFPGKDDWDKINTKASLFFWTFYLSKLRVKKEGLYKEIYEANADGLNSYDAYIRNATQQTFKQLIVEKARQFFTFEQMFGMCIYCSNFWISLLMSAGFVLIPSIHFYELPKMFLFLSFIFSHFIIRKILN